MTLKYDISQFGQSWCLNDGLDQGSRKIKLSNIQGDFV
jgi:hypothetical protein